MSMQVVTPAGKGEKHDEPHGNVLSREEGAPCPTRRN